MKELSIEEKAKAYDEALERARNLHKDAVEMENNMTTKICEIIFPELKESEDEKIRKRIIQALHGDVLDMEETTKAIAWLEKQGNNINCIYDKELSELLHIVICRYINDPNISYPERENVSKKILPYVELLEKQGQHAKFINNIQIGDQVTRNQDGMLVNLSQLKRVAKHADKVEPKFHEGEWIIHHGTENIYQVVAVIDNQYQLKYGDNYTVQKCADVDRCARLWDVTKDAKDGDVLAAEDKDKIFIYNGKLDLRGRVCAYCGIYKTYDGLRFTKCAIGNYFTYKEPYPATKEQRDTLFAKMKEAGYEWSSEHRKLIKRE